MRKILTIVIPSYNTSPFIDDSLKTFLDERFLDDIEIIIVDDGSKDDTAKKAMKFVDMYPESIKLISKENGGHGSGINVGIQNATGKYFKVVDGDDYVNTEEMFRFVQQLKGNDADMFVSYFSTLSEATGAIHSISPYDYRMIEKHKEIPVNKVFPAEEILGFVYASIHAVTFRTSILVDNRIRMTEKIFYEDNEFVLFPVEFVQSVFMSDCNVYVYRIDQANQSISKANTQKRVGELKKIVEGLSIHYERSTLEKSDPRKQYMLMAIANQIYTVFGVYITFEKDKSIRRKELMKFDASIRAISRETYNKANSYKLVKVCRMFHYCLYPLLAGRRLGGVNNERGKRY